MLRILAMTKREENAFVGTGVPDGPEKSLQVRWYVRFVSQRSVKALLFEIVQFPVALLS